MRYGLMSTGVACVLSILVVGKAHVTHGFTIINDPSATRGIERYDLMHNGLGVVRLKCYPAQVGDKDIITAFREIMEEKAPAITHLNATGLNRAELRSWPDVGIDPQATGNGVGCYNEIGGGTALQDARRRHPPAPRSSTCGWNSSSVRLTG